ncbi:hypothetical protein EG329_001682 [Mollisiaceae sp. DMI_Dod_QoI]|nr:hypothetical protein EG329_001682 [Helotiales sp. DMI_Dod_QoI]
MDVGPAELEVSTNPTSFYKETITKVCLEVKCDEQRPACGQCVRLGHECDYNPRLSFRDDTPRIVERMQEGSTLGSYVWDYQASNPETRYTEGGEDLLPPFQALTTDEEREKKAELHKPGTYHVIANPRSFASLPEYRDENMSMLGRVEGLLQFGPDPSREAPRILQSDQRDQEDPDVVILSTFEDTTRRSSINSFRQVTNPPSPERSAGDIATSRISQSNISQLEHYRRVLSPKIFKTERSDGEEDIFEMQARTYPPLFHAIMALDQLTQSVRIADALEHYQQVIPALQRTVRSSQDSYSDGAFFTHYVLLLYEIVAALHGDSNMSQQHSNQLLRIIRLRRQANSMEPYEFISYMLYQACVIYAHTSMFPGQLDDPIRDLERVITLGKEIIDAARVVLSKERYDYRFIVFPVFMAGFATQDPVEKRIALDLILAIEEHEYRGSTADVRQLLQKLYERQRSATMETGDANSVDWIEEMEKSGQGFIM